MSIATTGALGSPPAEPPAGFQPPQPRSLLNYAKHADLLAFMGWTISTTLPVGFLGPIRYMAAAYFTAALLVFARQVGPAVGRCWPLFMLPVLCAISAFWAASVDEALRKSIGLALTGLVAAYVATRIPGRKILLAYFVAEMIAAVMSLASNQIFEGAWMGIFGQKNFFAVNMFILYVCAAGITLDPENNRWLRRLALAVLPFAFFLVFMGKSGTTTLLVIGTTAVMFGQAFVWQPAARIPNARAFIILSLATIVLITAYIALGVLQIDPMKEILGALGKDSTLTGRTILWDTAQQVMDEHPWTGLGPKGYWRPEHGAVYTITAIVTGLEGISSFSFHNSYFENGVNYGYPGFYATIVLSTWACASAALNWLRNQSAVNAAFLVFALMIVLRSLSEADLSGEFGAMVMILFISAGRKEHLAKRHIQGVAPSSATRQAGA